MTEIVKKLLSSKKLPFIIIGLFLFQSVWFANTIRHDIPPDERYHFELSYYYANRPLLSSPFIKEQPEKYYTLGDIERTPNYLFHYITSFPLRIANNLSITEKDDLVNIVRYTNIIFSLLGIFILYKIFKLLEISDIKINLIFFALTTTGMYLWISAAHNYDNLAMPLFWLSLFYLLKLIKTNKENAVYLIAFGAAAMVTILIKVTFAPVLAFAFITTIVFLLKNRKFKIKKLKKEIRLNNWKLIITMFIFLIVGALFSERIVGNYLNYGAISPSCTTIHSKDQCENYGLYQRSENQKRVVEELKSEGKTLEINPVEYTSNWLQLMYDRIYFYLGHKLIEPSQEARLIGLVTVLYLLVILGLKKKKLITNQQLMLLLLVTIFYILLLFFFNLSGYRRNWARFGWQGRYLLPIIPFVYIFVVLLFANVYNSSKKHTKQVLGMSAAIIIMLNLYFHSPLLVFYRGSYDRWYRDSTVETNNTIRGYLQIMHLVTDDQVIQYKLNSISQSENDKYSP